jgi:hypothetical protein
MVVPVTVFADESAPKVSYSAKKQGRVAFQDNAPQGQITAAEEATDPASIEPAAGGFEPAEQTQEKSLSDTMKLPRKN